MSQSHAAASMSVVLWLFLVGLGLVVLGRALRAYPIVILDLVFALTCVGFGLFATAKFSLIRRGNLVSFGTRDMTPLNRRLYRLGYVFMLGSWALASVALAAKAVGLG